MIDMKYFEITEDHLKLLRRMYISWDHCEFGAPAVDCKRPYGNSDVYGDIAEILDLYIPDDEDGCWSDIADIKYIAYMDKIHQEMQTVLQIGVRIGYFKPGFYECEKYSEDWKLVE
jgi:hypothetical protein